MNVSAWSIRNPIPTVMLFVMLILVCTYHWPVCFIFFCLSYALKHSIANTSVPAIHIARVLTQLHTTTRRWHNVADICRRNSDASRVAVCSNVLRVVYM